MPKRASNRIDLDFRPQSYWDHADPASAILQNIKGQVRRDMAHSVLEGAKPGSVGPIEPALLDDELDDSTRVFFGLCHPAIKFIDEVEGGFHENTGHRFVENIISGVEPSAYQISRRGIETSTFTGWRGGRGLCGGEHSTLGRVATGRVLVRGYRI